MRFNDDPLRDELETLVPRRPRQTSFEGLVSAVDEDADEPVYGSSGTFGVEAAWVQPDEDAG